MKLPGLRVRQLIRVLELGHIVAGPSAGLILADLGFEVIKIEKPGTGDISRRLSKQSSGAFPFYNRGKKYITLDISSERDSEIFKELLLTSDIVIDNLGPGAVERAGFSYEKIHMLNKRIIYLSLKGYAKGPYEKRKSLDYPIEVHSGLAYMTGLKGRPMRVGASIIDMSAAMFGVIGVLQAMMEREQSGEGKYVDIGMFETAAYFMGQHIATSQIEHMEMEPINEEGFAWGVYDFFTTRDDLQVFIAVTTDPQWEKFCEGFGLEVCGDPMYRTNEGRFDRRNTLMPIIRRKISSMTSSEASEILEGLNIGYAFLNRPSDLLNDPHMSKKMISILYNGSTIRVPKTPVGYASKGNPGSLGQDNDEILGELGKFKTEKKS